MLDRWKERERREYWRAGIVAATLANCFRDSKNRREPYRPEDFMPSYAKASEGRPSGAGASGGGPRRLTPEEMAEKVKAIHAALGGTAASGD